MTARGVAMPRALAVLALFLSALGLLSTPLHPYDDCALLMGARLVAAGKTPYVDFYAHYGPLGYSLLSVLTEALGSAGLALRVGQIVLLAVVAALWFFLSRSLDPPSLLREYALAPLVLVFSQVAVEPVFFGFAFAAIAGCLFAYARTSERRLSAVLLLLTAGVALAVAAAIRPGLGAYVVFALLVLEVAARRPHFGAMRSPVLVLALALGTAAATALVLAFWLYPNISLSLALNATVLVPARLVSAGGLYLNPTFLSLPVVGEIVAGAALTAASLAWVTAAAGRKARRVAVRCIAVGGILPLRLLFSSHPARETGFLALILLVLAGVAVFAGRRELQESPLLRTSAAFGLAAAAFGHYFWARADGQHLVPFLALALSGGAFLLPAVTAPTRIRLIGAVALFYVVTPWHFALPATKLAQQEFRVRPLPWRCSVPLEDARRAVALADRLADPNSRFVAVGTTQAWTSGDPIELFLLSSRLPYTKWFQYDPGVQSSPEIQAEMERELEASGSRTAVVWKAGFFRWAGEDPRRHSSPFDDFFRRVYPVSVAKIGDYEVRSRDPLGAMVLGMRDSRPGRDDDGRKWR